MGWAWCWPWVLRECCRVLQECPSGAPMKILSSGQCGVEKSLGLWDPVSRRICVYKVPCTKSQQHQMGSRKFCVLGLEVWKYRDSPLNLLVWRFPCTNRAVWGEGQIWDAEGFPWILHTLLTRGETYSVYMWVLLIFISRNCTRYIDTIKMNYSDGHCAMQLKKSNKFGLRKSE